MILEIVVALNAVVTIVVTSILIRTMRELRYGESVRKDRYYELLSSLDSMSSKFEGVKVPSKEYGSYPEFLATEKMVKDHVTAALVPFWALMRHAGMQWVEAKSRPELARLEAIPALSKTERVGG